MSATPDSTSVNPEQLIADLQRQLAEREAELAECKAERDEGLQRETATAEVMGVINSSHGDLAPVFDAILTKATGLCEAIYGTLCTFDGEGFHPITIHGDREFADWLRQRSPLLPLPRSPFERIVLGERFVHIADTEKDSIYHSPGFRELVEIGRIRSHLVVALRKDDRLVGTLVVFRREVHPFTDRQVALLQNFAVQAVIAMENARLLTETREALEQQTATAEVLQVINSSPGDLKPVFDAMIERAARLCEADEAALRTFDGELLHLAAVHGSDPDVVLRLQQLGPTRAFGLYEPFARGERMAHYADVRETEIFHENEVVRARLELRGIRAWLAVALQKDGVLLGVINVHRHTVRPFSEEQIALLQNFAAQAVIAMENARLLTETREALEQQTATAEVLQVINSSPGTLKPVFDAMLERALRLCGASFGNLLSYNGELFDIVASVHAEGRIADRQRYRPPFRMIPRSVLQTMVQGAEVGFVEDVRQSGSYRADELFREMVDSGGYRSLLNIALRKESELVGVIGIFRTEVRPFTDKQIALLQNFAAQAVIAMENARLITETREALELQTATAEILQVINSSPGDLVPVFDAVLDRAMRLCAGSHAALELYDGERMHAVAVHGASDMFAETLRSGYPATDSPASRALLEGGRFAEIADAAQIDHVAFQAAAKLDEIRTVLFVPLRRDGAFLGMIASARREVRPFSEKEIALLENFAAQAVIAMENARLLGELRQRTDQVAELNRGLEARVAEQVEELGRVGRLKRFLAPQLAELIVSQGDEKLLESHRREIVVVFCDVRGYTAFTETAEPEEVLDFLREYHGALGPLVSQFEGTLDQFSGDGIMVFFNDPVPCPDPAERAVKMAMAMREASGRLIVDWRERGRELGFGAGIAQGYATLGQIGFSERSGYTAIGTVCNVAARLCAEAKDGQILLSQRVNVALRGSVVTDRAGALALKGLAQPVVAYNVPLVGSQASFRVVEGGAPTA